MTKMNAVAWFDIYVNDLKRAVTFYEAVLGHKLEKMGDPTGEMQMMSFPADMNSYGAAGALTKSEHASPGIGGTVIYFSSQDTAVEEARVEKAGGKVVRSNSYGAAGALTKSEHASPGIGGTVIYFSSQDTAVEEARVEKAGGKVVRSKFSIGEFGWVTLCQDTEGNMFGLNSL